jgi:hypothetical protein
VRALVCVESSGFIATELVVESLTTASLHAATFNADSL